MQSGALQGDALQEQRAEWLELVYSVGVAGVAGESQRAPV